MTMRMMGSAAGLLMMSALAACVSDTSPTAAPASPAEALAPYYAGFSEPLPRKPQGAPLDPSRVVSRIAFGSCLQQDEPAPVLRAVASVEPDLFVMLGDNVYGDAYAGDLSLPELRRAYADLAANPDFQAVASAAPILATWDDHDYAVNDGGRDFSGKAFAETVFETFWDQADGGRPGVYSAVTLGEPGRDVNLILLDTRFFRSSLTPTDERGAEGKERYAPSADPAQEMLGADQWAWLEAELAEPAALTVVVSSIQVLADGHGWEAWRMMPKERDRLYALLAKTRPEGLVLVSGDRHRAGIYQVDRAYRENGSGLEPLIELTASSINKPVTAWGGKEEAGPNRIGPTYLDANFGQLDIDWEARTASISVRDAAGGEVMRASFAIPNPTTN